MKVDRIATSELRSTKRTTWWKITHDKPLEKQTSLLEATIMLATGGTVAFPTETVYGLGADARNSVAVEQIFVAKGRPADNPLIVHIADIAQLNEFVLPYSEQVTRLMKWFWPGPLTIVLPVRVGIISTQVTAGLQTVAVRMPAHPVAQTLIRAAHCPIAAPSANRSGRPSPTCATHVRADLDGRIDGVVDGGVTGIGIESTVVELHDQVIHVLRPGGITVEMLQKMGEKVTVAEQAFSSVNIEHTDSQVGVQQESDERIIVQADRSVPRSPGMKYAHYAPQGKLYIVQGTSFEQGASCIQKLLVSAKKSGEKTAVLAFTEHIGCYEADMIVSLGSVCALKEAAHLLYDALRRCDEEEVTYIVAEACSTQGIGLAVMNRLSKAAGHRIIDCHS